MDWINNHGGLFALFLFLLPAILAMAIFLDDVGFAYFWTWYEQVKRDHENSSRSNK